ncbi:hypothetical protein [Paenibacillus beijingensis]|uniref:Butirosin biosynthesis protein H N-terminal domain-containing protein n=1 Tax=Paenibacillus beijingensis TaxID=1126833 RepID=A0A0D5NMW9_9BACL|nr:hypothetical protein [Paenibacillus beijingensis]AJY76268.1 hypothetical protein VN24_19015 [Paenibacillus beijingensis]
MKKINLEKLIRYDINYYFDCIKTKIFHYCLYLGAPIDWLLYNSYENTKNIYNQIVLNKNPYWAYKTNCINIEDLNKISIKLESRLVNEFDNALSYFEKKINKGEVLLIKCDEYFLPHREWVYKQKHTQHYVFISGYDYTNTTKKLHIIDDGYPDFSGYSYDINIIENSYSKEIIRPTYQINDLDKHFTEEIIIKYREYFMNVEDDLSLYEEIVNYFYDIDCQSDRDSDFLFYFVHAVSLLSGSRLIFIRFLYLFNESSCSDLINELIDCSKKLSILKFFIKRYSISFEENDKKEIINKCKELKVKEGKIYEMLRENSMNHFKKNII